MKRPGQRKKARAGKTGKEREKKSRGEEEEKHDRWGPQWKQEKRHKVGWGPGNPQKGAGWAATGCIYSLGKSQGGEVKWGERLAVCAGSFLPSLQPRTSLQDSGPKSWLRFLPAGIRSLSGLYWMVSIKSHSAVICACWLVGENQFEYRQGIKYLHWIGQNVGNPLLEITMEKAS